MYGPSGIDQLAGHGHLQVHWMYDGHLTNDLQNAAAGQQPATLL
jgi:hypothetical protein